MNNNRALWDDITNLLDEKYIEEATARLQKHEENEYKTEATLIIPEKKKTDRKKLFRGVLAAAVTVTVVAGVTGIAILDGRMLPEDTSSGIATSADNSSSAAEDENGFILDGVEFSKYCHYGEDDITSFGEVAFFNVETNGNKITKDHYTECYKIAYGDKIDFSTNETAKALLDAHQQMTLMLNESFCNVQYIDAIEHYELAGDKVRGYFKINEDAPIYKNENHRDLIYSDIYLKQKEIYADIENIASFDEKFSFLKYEDGYFYIRGTHVGNTVSVVNSLYNTLYSEKLWKNFYNGLGFTPGENAYIANVNGKPKLVFAGFEGCFNGEQGNNYTFRIMELDLVKTESGYKIDRNIDWENAYYNGYDIRAAESGSENQPVLFSNEYASVQNAYSHFKGSYTIDTYNIDEWKTYCYSTNTKSNDWYISDKLSGYYGLEKVYCEETSSPELHFGDDSLVNYDLSYDIVFGSGKYFDFSIYDKSAGKAIATQLGLHENAEGIYFRLYSDGRLYVRSANGYDAVVKDAAEKLGITELKSDLHHVFGLSNHNGVLYFTYSYSYSYDSDGQDVCQKIYSGSEKKIKLCDLSDNEYGSFSVDADTGVVISTVSYKDSDPISEREIADMLDNGYYEAVTDKGFWEKCGTINAGLYFNGTFYGTRDFNFKENFDNMQIITDRKLYDELMSNVIAMEMLYSKAYDINSKKQFLLNYAYVEDCSYYAGYYDNYHVHHSEKINVNGKTYYALSPDRFEFYDSSELYEYASKYLFNVYQDYPETFLPAGIIEYDGRMYVDAERAFWSKHPTQNTNKRYVLAAYSNGTIVSDNNTIHLFIAYSDMDENNTDAAFVKKYTFYNKDGKWMCNSISCFENEYNECYKNNQTTDIFNSNENNKSEFSKTFIDNYKNPSPLN